jgi:hypothetical protein
MQQCSCCTVFVTCRVNCWIINLLGNQNVEIVVMVLGLNLARLLAILYKISVNFLILV